MRIGYEYRDMYYFGDRLNKILIKKDMYKTELADAMNVNPSTIHRWIRGDSYPDIIQIDKLCNILNVTPNYLIIGK